MGQKVISLVNNGDHSDLCRLRTGNLSMCILQADSTLRDHILPYPPESRVLIRYLKNADKVGNGIPGIFQTIL